MVEINSSELISLIDFLLAISLLVFISTSGEQFNQWRIENGKLTIMVEINFVN